MRALSAISSRRLVWPIGCVFAASLIAVGCSHQTTQDEANALQQKAMNDPFGYSPDPNKPDDTVSGNGSFDKQGLKRDVDHVLNP
ncbi:MAG TPA: hypothetical protein VN541_01260 [Tepidisphaeraceae bacterium]|nr:hypothetical protein [Tepidisphaeraceae bacterium]